MRFGVLGPLIPDDVVRPARRRLLSILLLEREITRDRLIDRMWGEAAPRTARNAIQVHVNGLRARLPAGTIETTDVGYRMATHVTLDIDDFEARLVSARTASKDISRLRHADAALELWRGDPYQELTGDDFARAEISRLAELRSLAGETKVEALLGLGREDEAIADLRHMIRDDPLRESLHGHLMLALYRGGRQADALRAYQAVRRTLGEDLGIEPSPSLRELEERILLQDPTLGRLRTDEPPTNLPLQATSFVGREDAVEEIVTALAPDTCVTLAGGPGFGKTRLAIEAASSVLRDHPDGVWFVSLSGASTDLDVAAEIATAVGLQTSIQSFSDLAEAIAVRRIVVVLDNCEHVIDSCRAFASDVLSRSGNASLLATSRRPLGVTGETVFRVQSLTAHRHSTAGSPLTDASVQLFLDRAHSYDPSFTLDDATADAVLGLVHRLDGVPLAIELAARWTSALEITEIADMLDMSDALQRDGGHPLGSAIDWSLDLLASDDRDLLLHTSVFHGSYTLDAAYDICGPGRTRPGFSAAMARLVDSSLVVIERGATGLRYRSLAPIRDRLLSIGSRDADTARRHAQFFLTRAAAGIDDLYGAATDQDDIEASIADIRAALSYGLDIGMENEVGRALARLTHYFHPRYLHWESQAWLDRALATNLDPVVRAYALRAKGSGAQILGKQSEASAAFEEAIEIFERHGMTDWAMRVLLSLSGVYSDSGRWQEGVDAARRNLKFVASTDDPSAVAMATYYVGENQFGAGDVVAGMTSMAAAAGAFVAEGEHGRVAYTASQAARAAFLSGDTAEAQRLADMAAQAARRAGNAYALGKSAAAGALVALMTGDPTAAARQLAEANRHVSPGHPDEVTDVLIPSCFVLSAVDESQLAAEIASGIVQSFTESENVLPIPWKRSLDRWAAASSIDGEALPLATLRTRAMAALI